MLSSQAFVTHGSESAAFWQFNILWQMMATGLQTDGKFVLIDETMQLNGPSTHTHTQDEGLYVVEGRATFNAGGKHGIAAGPGTFVAIPKLTEHSFQVQEANSRLLNFYLPAGFEMILMGSARTAATRAPPPPERTREWLPAPWVAAKLNADYGTRYKFTAGHSTNPDHMLTEATPGATVFPFTANIDGAKHNFHHRSALWGILASSQATGGAYSLFELRLSPRRGNLYESRVFADRDTALFILSGHMIVSWNDESHNVQAGALVWIPQNTVHSIRTTGDAAPSSPSCLYLQTPGGLDELITFVGTATGDTSPPSADFQDKMVADQQELDEICTRLGLRDL